MARTRRRSGNGLDLYKRLGAEIERARAERGLTQTQLGSAIGEAQTTISDYEQAKTRVPLDAIVAIEDALGLARGFLFGAAGYVPATDDVIELIRRDPTINEDRRNLILAMYGDSRKHGQPSG